MSRECMACGCEVKAREPLKADGEIACSFFCQRRIWKDNREAREAAAKKKGNQCSHKTS